MILGKTTLPNKLIVTIIDLFGSLPIHLNCHVICFIHLGEIWRLVTFSKSLACVERLLGHFNGKKPLHWKQVGHLTTSLEMSLLHWK